jgi:hypothetical protein
LPPMFLARDWASSGPSMSMALLKVSWSSGSSARVPTNAVYQTR